MRKNKIEHDRTDDRRPDRCRKLQEVAAENLKERMTFRQPVNRLAVGKDKMQAEISRQRAERYDDERDLQDACQHAVEAAEDHARQQRESHRDPGIDVMKLDEQRR